MALCQSLSSLCSSCSVALLLLLLLCECVCVSEPNLAASPSSCSTVPRSNWFQQCERTDTQTPSVLLPSLPHSVVSLTRPSTFSTHQRRGETPTFPFPPFTLLVSSYTWNFHGTEMQNTLPHCSHNSSVLRTSGSILNELNEMDSVKQCICNCCFSLMHIASAHFLGYRNGSKIYKWRADEAAVMNVCLMLYILSERRALLLFLDKWACLL